LDDANQLQGTTTIERHFDGVGAVHGGAIAILLDDLMGRLANSAGRPMARTAFLHIDFRAPVPWGVPLSFQCRITSTVGRKRFVEGRLDRDGEVLSHANGLWVAMKAD
jgi:acyl-coenzyme A thioesterase PaaI-like protein